MGTHPNAPATVRGTDKTTLKVKLDERSLSPEVFRCFNGDLPFLFKVLSVGQALSIQAVCCRWESLFSLLYERFTII